MDSFLFVKHRDLTEDLLTSICLIKASAWDYPIEEHKRWILENLKDSDIHVILEVDGNPMAYLNLVRTQVKVNNHGYVDVIGVGNVCCKSKNNGIGSRLMKVVSNYFLANDLKAILFCGQRLLTFYKSFGFMVSAIFEDGKHLLGFNLEDMPFQYEGENF